MALDVLRSSYDVRVLEVFEACCVELRPLRCRGPGFCRSAAFNEFEICF